MKMVWLAVLSLVMASLPGGAQAPQSPGCGAGSTLKDMYSASDTKRAEQFLVDLKAAVNAKDRGNVAAMVQYPLRVNLPNGRHQQIRTQQQFRARYDFLFNSRTRKAIDAQVPRCMFARDQGVMIGNGEIWFQDFGGRFKIWSFNHMD